MPIVAAFGAYWLRFWRVLTIVDLRFARLFAPEGVRFANLFLVRRHFAGITAILEGFRGHDPETIHPENCHSVQWPMTLCRDSIDSVCGNSRVLERIGSSHRPFGTCFVGRDRDRFRGSRYQCGHDQPGKLLQCPCGVPLALRLDRGRMRHQSSSVGTWVAEVHGSLPFAVPRARRPNKFANPLVYNSTVPDRVKLSRGRSRSTRVPAPLRTATGSSVPDDIACSSASLPTPMLSSTRSRFRL
jgi:hypothetical protein